jgi:hypothetical protein
MEHCLLGADQGAQVLIRGVSELSPAVDDERVLTGHEGRPQERDRGVGADVGGRARADARYQYFALPANRHRRRPGTSIRSDGDQIWSEDEAKNLLWQLVEGHRHGHVAMLWGRLGAKLDA